MSGMDLVYWDVDHYLFQLVQLELTTQDMKTNIPGLLGPLAMTVQMMSVAWRPKMMVDLTYLQVLHYSDNRAKCPYGTSLNLVNYFG